MRRILAVLLVCCLLLGVTGCDVGGREVAVAFWGSHFSVFKMASSTCPDKEVRVYLANYKNIYGKVGESNLWDGDFDVDRMEEAIKNLAAEHLARVYSMNLYARDNDIALTDKEKDKIQTAAAAYYASLNDTEKKYMRASESDIEKMYRRYALAEKVYFSLMNTIDDEISEDEARIMDGYVLYTTNGQTADAIEAALAAGESFEKLCAMYSETDKGEVSFGRGTYPEQVEEEAFALEDDTATGRITADDGWYFVYCIDKYDKALSEEHKTAIVEEKKAEAIESIISEQSENYYSYFNEDHLAGIAFDTDSAITTNSFFSTLETYLSYRSN